MKIRIRKEIATDESKLRQEIQSKVNKLLNPSSANVPYTAPDPCFWLFPW